MTIYNNSMIYRAFTLAGETKAAGRTEASQLLSTAWGQMHADTDLALVAETLRRAADALPVGNRDEVIHLLSAVQKYAKESV